MGGFDWKKGSSSAVGTRLANNEAPRPGKSTWTEHQPAQTADEAIAGAERTVAASNSRSSTQQMDGEVVAPASRPTINELFGNVQMRATAGGSDSETVQASAQRGIASPSSPLPFLSKIQELFGRHDVSGVEAHIGGPAAHACRDIGATAFAAGNHVAFAAEPDVHTAAHEAAHVVQQRAGVHLKGGVGETGDVYERNADEVADRVVRGEGVADLLPGGRSSPVPGSQRTEEAETLQRKDSKEGPRGPQGPKGDKGDKGAPGESYDAVYWEEFHGMVSKAAGAWSFIAQKQALAIRAIQREIEKPKKPQIADSIIEGLIIGALQAATGGIAGFVASRITKAVGDAVAAQLAENTSKAMIQALSTSIVDAAKDGIKGTIRQIVQPKLLKLIQGGTDHADAFFEAQEDAAIDSGKVGEETVLTQQKDIAAMAAADKKAPLVAAEALFRAASSAYDQAVEVQKDTTLKAWYSYKAQLTFGTTAKGGTDIGKVSPGMYESTEGQKPTGFLTIRVVKKPGWNDLSISLMEKPDPSAWVLKNQSVYLPDSTKAMAGRVENKPVGDSAAASVPTGGDNAPRIPIMLFLQNGSGMYRPLAILRNEVGETRADDAMSSSSANGSDWFEDTTCWLAAKAGDKIITEAHLLRDKHYPSGGDAAVLRGIDVLMAEVANLGIKDYIVPDRR